MLTAPWTKAPAILLRQLCSENTEKLSAQV
jgi:hypothetical protein